MFHLNYYKAIFWDFDGVIKDSQDAKSDAFFQVFAPYGRDVQEKSVAHHRANGGVSRTVKIPYYFQEYVNGETSQETIDQAIAQFGTLSHGKTMASPWVSGVIEYLAANHKTQDFYIVTGTPQEEIDVSAAMLKIDPFFKSIHGAPAKKEVIIKDLMAKHAYKKEDCLMIGDAKKDQFAADQNQIDFLLRDTAENKPLFLDYAGQRVADFQSFL